MNSLQTTDDLTKKVLRVVTRTTSIDPTRLSHTARLEDIYRDSLELFALISAFEAEFSLKASYTELMHIETIGDIVSYVRQKTTPTGTVMLQESLA